MGARGANGRGRSRHSPRRALRQRNRRRPPSLLVAWRDRSQHPRASLDWSMAATTRVGIGGCDLSAVARHLLPARARAIARLAFAAATLAQSRSTRPSTAASPKSWAAWGAAVPTASTSPSRARGMRHPPAPRGRWRRHRQFPPPRVAASVTKLGPILWMLAARLKFDRDDIAAFLDLLPRDLDG